MGLQVPLKTSFVWENLMESPYTISHHMPQFNSVTQFTSHRNIKKF